MALNITPKKSSAAQALHFIWANSFTLATTNEKHASGMQAYPLEWRCM
jgi:hypothetical protein